MLRLDDLPRKRVVKQPNRGHLFHFQTRGPLLGRDHGLLECQVGRTLVRGDKPRTDLGSLRAQHQRGHHRPAVVQPARRDDRHPARFRHRWDQAHGRRFLAAVVASGFKPFGHHRIHPGRFRLQRKLHAAHHVHHLDAMGFQVRGPRRWVARAREHDGHLHVHDALHVFLHGGIEQRHVHGKRPSRCRGLGFCDVVAKHLGVHASRAQNPKPACVAHRARQFPPAAPHHAGLDDGHLDAQKGAHSVFRVHGVKFGRAGPIPHLRSKRSCPGQERPWRSR